MNKNENMISDWLDQNGNPEIERFVDKQMKIKFMYDIIIVKARKMLDEADSGTIDCKTYNEGFIDGIRYANKTFISNMKNQLKFNMDEIENYRKLMENIDINSDDFKTMEHYVNSLLSVNAYIDENLILKVN